jgi:hypothetical protein
LTASVTAIRPSLSDVASGKRTGVGETRGGAQGSHAVRDAHVAAAVRVAAEFRIDAALIAGEEERVRFAATCDAVAVLA